MSNYRVQWVQDQPNGGHQTLWLRIADQYGRLEWMDSPRNATPMSFVEAVLFCKLCHAGVLTNEAFFPVNAKEIV